jgi:hypothetical protein
MTSNLALNEDSQLQLGKGGIDQAEVAADLGCQAWGGVGK